MGDHDGNRANGKDEKEKLMHLQRGNGPKQWATIGETTKSTTISCECSANGKRSGMR
jgi:hypothetical protein